MMLVAIDDCGVFNQLKFRNQMGLITEETNV